MGKTIRGVVLTLATIGNFIFATTLGFILGKEINDLWSGIILISLWFCTLIIIGSNMWDEGREIR